MKDEMLTSALRATAKNRRALYRALESGTDLRKTIRRYNLI